MKKLEEYQIKNFGEIITIRLYVNGEHRCSCNKFAKRWNDCYHIQKLKINKAEIVGARRFEVK
jgi:hypothetical protein